MLSFTSGLRADNEAFAIFVNEKYDFQDKKGVLSGVLLQKINSFLKSLKARKKEENISSFDISDKQKCFIVKVKSNFESYWPQESGGLFFSYLKKNKDIKRIDLYVDSLNFDKDKLVNFSSQFIFGFYLKSYTFSKYKTLEKEKINKKINLKIITTNKEKVEKKYKYYDAIKEGVFLSRDLVSEPPNVLNPKTYVNEIQKLSKLGLKIKSYNEKELKKLGLNALLGVGQGSFN